ncbi:hypothetical protein [Sphaerisporangium aureirubrum]|uniref:Uncharacterized protein n=1 Tax=Sphaerisporangium aureirubrum TaxID=1544736 RepID=A0ABW1NE56_9ACTN
MRNLTFCDIRLHPSTVTSTFEKAMTTDVMPGAGDLPHPPGTLFVRSLYREAGDGFPPAYLCVVNSVLVSDSGFFAMRPRIQQLGADTTDPRFRSVAGALPYDEAALDVLRLRPSHSLLLVTVHLPLRMIQEIFEQELVLALQDEISIPSRVNNAEAAFWTRDDSIVPGRVEYIIAAIGSFPSPTLRPGNRARIEKAGGTITTTHRYHHVTTPPTD